MNEQEWLKTNQEELEGCRRFLIISTLLAIAIIVSLIYLFK